MNTNLLDLNNDVLNLIGDYVKKDNFERKIMKEIQILNGKIYRFTILITVHIFYVTKMGIIETGRLKDIYLMILTFIFWK